MRRRLSILALFLAFCLAVSPAVFSEGEVPIYRHGNASGKVALSFDDGPHPTYTDEILSILEEYQVRATFFVIGENVRAYPEIACRIASGGHEIGNHTDTHVFLSALSLAATAREVADAEKTILEVTGEKPQLFRPPGGSYSDKKLAAIADMGYTSVLWSKDTRDWTRPTVERVVDAALEDLSAGDIILFHDFNVMGSPTPDALRRIIPTILEMGYEIVPVSEVLEG